MGGRHTAKEEGAPKANLVQKRRLRRAPLCSPHSEGGPRQSHKRKRSPKTTREGMATSLQGCRHSPDKAFLFALFICIFPKAWSNENWVPIESLNISPYFETENFMIHLKNSNNCLNEPFCACSRSISVCNCVLWWNQIKHGVAVIWKVHLLRWKAKFYFFAHISSFFEQEAGTSKEIYKH